MTTKNIRIGTSGWHYNHWYKVFYPDRMPTGEMLTYFCRYFDTVEVNNTFYALPLETTFRRWKDTVPPDFTFAVKGSRYITHIKKLTEPQEPLKRFLPLAQMLNEKLGPILFQFPNTWELNMERLERFLELLPQIHRYAFEFRHPSWHNDHVYSLLRKHQSAFCFYDFGGHPSPLPITTDFVYGRLHGGPENGNYTVEQLDAWSRRIREWASVAESVYFYFNNDGHGYAVNNALYLKKRLGIQ